jgi:hypothetical protein
MDFKLNIKEQDWKVAEKAKAKSKLEEDIAYEKSKILPTRSSYQSYYITTNSSTIIDGIIEWDSKGLLQLDAISLQDVKDFLNNYFKGKWVNIYRKIPMVNLLYKKGVIKRYKI